MVPPLLVDHSQISFLLSVLFGLRLLFTFCVEIETRKFGSRVVFIHLCFVSSVQLRQWICIPEISCWGNLFEYSVIFILIIESADFVALASNIKSLTTGR